MSTGPEWGALLRQAREAKGWTQARVAYFLGVQRAHICKIEHDMTHASVRTFFDLCMLLDISIELRKAGAP